jgi:hypothetical protein
LLAGSDPWKTVEAFGAYLESWAKDGFAEQVQGNPAAVQVIVGEHDPALSAAVMEQTWLAFYPNAELEVLPTPGTTRCSRPRPRSWRRSRGSWTRGDRAAATTRARRHGGRVRPGHLRDRPQQWFC